MPTSRGGRRADHSRPAPRRCRLAGAAARAGACPSGPSSIRAAHREAALGDEAVLPALPIRQQ
jgi:hypothetical protein